MSSDIESDDVDLSTKPKGKTRRPLPTPNKKYGKSESKFVLVCLCVLISMSRSHYQQINHMFTCVTSRFLIELCSLDQNDFCHQPLYDAIVFWGTMCQWFWVKLKQRQLFLMTLLVCMHINLRAYSQSPIQI